MVEYSDTTLFPAARDRVWALLQDHADDAKIGQIHPLITTQRTVARDSETITVERMIDVRGRPMRSVWKLTYRPPDLARWEVVESAGPWAPGSYLENRYAEVLGGTQITTRGDLRISVLPFFMSQASNVRKVMASIHDEDVAFLAR